jgi:primosomal protein N' (replication factor Y)
MTNHQQNLFQTEPEPWELDEADERLVAGVAFAEAPYGPFDYLVPERLRGQVEPGRRVRVPLGRSNRLIVGYCVRTENQRADTRRLKEVKAVVDAQTLLSPPMLRLTEWIADYYLCEWGQAIEGVVPAGVRGQAGTREVTVLSVPTNVAARLTQLKLPRKQAEILKRLAASPRPLTLQQLAAAAKCTMGPINALREKKLVREEVRRVQHAEVEETPEKREEHLKLNDDQQKALDTILSALNAGRHETVLMHGITGSGKTEVYIRAIDEVIHFGRQAIVLVPEISLTPQTRQRFRSRFDRVAVLHSHLSDTERHWHWQRIARGEIQVVVGARSAVFAPTPYLGLIVLDEEHDASFKQDNIPRYHARDVALYRAQTESVPMVLGSATPSLESWQRAVDGQYTLVELPKRVLDRPLPDVATIDLRAEFQSRSSRGAVSRQMHQAIDQALKDDGQVILLLNRRGYSTHIQCPACGHVVRCPHCDIALTHHRAGEKAICHYCDYQVDAPPVCPDCQFEGIRYGGLGTQKLEAEIRARFRDVSCLRMDSDTMQKPGSHEEALARFRAGEVKILLGTQMIAKGLDFPNVTLVGVINADTALHFPDFRAAERTFQLVTQVAGRTGRGDKGGRVLVQTFSPEHPAIQAALHHDFAKFVAQELPTRREYHYPPFAIMVRIIVRGPSETMTEQFAEQIAERLRGEVETKAIDARVLGPAAAPIAKLRGKFRFHTLLQATDGPALRAAVRQATSGLKPPDDVQWIVDVDPVDLL